MNDGNKPGVPPEVAKALKHATPYALTPPEQLFRFSSSTAPPGGLAPSVVGYQASSWWLRGREFALLCSRSQRGKLGLGLQARFDLAVLQEWGSRMDILVRATVRRRVDAWMGCPRTQRETAPNGIRITMPGRSDIQHVFIPGITDQSGLLTYYGRTALSVEETIPLDTHQLYKT
jgi:hypothetical protein